MLVWGASGGLGSYAIQLINAAGGNAIGVISDESKRDFVMNLGAKGVLNRKDFNRWGQLPTVNTPEYAEWFKEVRKFGKRFGTSRARATMLTWCLNTQVNPRSLYQHLSVKKAVWL